MRFQRANAARKSLNAAAIRALFIADGQLTAIDKPRGGGSGDSSKTRNFSADAFAKGKRVLTDSALTVELYDIGFGPHAEEMLVAYLPNEKILFQGDLLNRPSNGDYPIANDTTAHFAKWLEMKKLAVDKIVGVHGTVTTMDELRKAVAEMAKK